MVCVRAACFGCAACVRACGCGTWLLLSACCGGWFCFRGGGERGALLPFVREIPNSDVHSCRCLAWQSLHIPWQKEGKLKHSPKLKADLHLWGDLLGKRSLAQQRKPQPPGTHQISECCEMKMILPWVLFGKSHLASILALGHIHLLKMCRNRARTPETSPPEILQQKQNNPDFPDE